jgi:cytochrome c-type biogenesis protein CcmH
VGAMVLKKRFGLIPLLALLPLLLLSTRASAATVSGIANQLICQCGCNSVLSNCTHQECASRDAMTSLIGQKLAQGQSEAEIISFFTDQYGEQVLSAPTKRGFNLTAWILPFAAIAAGGVAIFFAIRIWVKRGEQHQLSEVNTVEKEEDSGYRQRLEKELREFGDRGFR